MRLKLRKVFTVMLMLVLSLYAFVMTPTNVDAKTDNAEAIQKIDLSQATVTSDSKHPSGTVSAASSIVDGKYNTSWVSNLVTNTTANSHFVKLELSEAVTLNQISMIPRVESGAGVYFPKDFTIQVSENGNEWKTVVNKSDFSLSGTGAVSFSFNTEKAVKYIKVVTTKNSGGVGASSTAYGFALAEIEAYYDPTAIQKIDLSQTTVTSDSKHPSGTVSAASAIVDGKYNTSWVSNLVTNTTANSHFVKLELSEAVALNQISMIPRVESGVGVYFPKNFTIQVSENGNEWKTVVNKSDFSLSGTEAVSFNFNTEKAVKYIKVVTTKNGGGVGASSTAYGFALAEMEAYYDPTAVQKIDLSQATVTSDSKHPSGTVSAASAIVDGKYNTSWVSNLDKNNTRSPHFVYVELKEAVTLNKITLIPRVESGVGVYFPKDFTIKLSRDGINWITVVDQIDYALDGTDGASFVFDTEYDMRHIKIEATQNTAGVTEVSRESYGFALAEIEAFYDFMNSSYQPVLSDVLKIESAEATSSHPIHPVKNLIDGSPNNIWSNNDSNNRPDQTANTQVVLKLESLSYVSGMYLYPRNTGKDVNFPHNFSIYLSEDGQNYGEAIYKTTNYSIGNSSEPQFLEFDEISDKAQYIKLDIAPGNNANGFVHIAEVKVLGEEAVDTDEYANNLIVNNPYYGEAKITYSNSNGIFKHEIVGSSYENIVDNRGYITYPTDAAKNVTLTIKIINIFDESDAVTIVREITVKTLNALQVEAGAENIELIYAPSDTDKYIKLPSVDGCTVTIAESDNENIIALDGKINRPSETTGVRLVLRVTKNGSGESALTRSLLVPIYKPRVQSSVTPEEIQRIKEDYEDNAYGIFVHYISEYIGMGSVYSDGNVVKDVDELARAFDAEAFARTVNELGAEYVVFTVWHGDVRTLFPSMTNKRWRDDRRSDDSMGVKTYSDIDVIADLINALEKYDVDLHLYTHPCDGHDFTEEDQYLTGWNDSANDYEIWNRYIRELYYELCERYGDKIKGLWFDGGYNHVPKGDAQERLREICTTFNPAMILTANVGFQEGNVFEKAPFNGADYFSWEIPKGFNFETERFISRHQSDINIANDGWFTRYPNTAVLNNIPTPEEMFRFLVALSSVSKEGGFLAATGFYPTYEGQVLDDYLTPGVGDALRILNNAYLSPMKQFIFDTNDSTAYPTTENVTVSQLEWGVANESKDGRYIYLHVFNAPDTNTLILPNPADKTFLKSAAVIVNYDGTETPVTIVKTNDGYSITIPDGVEWNAVDTVIKAERIEFDFSPKVSITLDTSLVLNVYVPVSSALKSFTLDGVTYTDLAALKDSIVTLSNSKDYYLFKIKLPSSKAARSVVLKATVTADEKDYIGTWTMSIPKYATKVIADGSDVEKTLIKDVLAYIRAAYVYFDADDKDEVITAIDEILGTYERAFEKVLGETNTEEGLKSVSIILDEKPIVRFVLPEGKTAENYTFKIGNKTLEYTTGTVTVDGKDHAYVELKLYAYQLIGEIAYTDGTYSGSFHINSYYDFVTTDEAHKNNTALITLVEKLYNYCKSAEAYRASVVSN